jgi:hypothetical protein
MFFSACGGDKLALRHFIGEFLIADRLLALKLLLAPFSQVLQTLDGAHGTSSMRLAISSASNLANAVRVSLS